MSVTAPSLQSRGPRRVLIVVLVGLAVALLWFVTQTLHYLTNYSPASYTGYFWHRRAGLIPHLTGGALAISAGLVQIWLGFTNRVGRLHRTLGKVYGGGVLLAAVGGIYLALTIPGHLAYSAGLLMLDVAWLITTGMALYAVRSHRIEQHREWMLRSYIVTFAFVTFRLATYWLQRWIHGPGAGDSVAEDIESLMAWACWAVPLLVAEPLIQLRSMKRSVRRQ
ncbi:MAG TPA: DUF2306 domain-containing protein [Steroidobacteraceae bacterium]